MLVNPSARPSKRKKSKRKAKTRAKTKGKVKTMAKKRRSAAQRAATKRLVALNRSRKSPARRRRRSSSPAKVKYRNRTRTVTKYRTRRPARRRVVARRNPSARGIINQMIMPAATQATGAIALDVLMGYTQGFLPAQLTSGPAKALVKGVAAIGIGMVVGKFGKRKFGKDMALGALTVTLHDLMRSTLEQAAPQVQLGYMDSGGGDMGIYDDWNSGSMGAYVNDGTAPAPQVGADPNMGWNAGTMGAYVDDF